MKNCGKIKTEADGELFVLYLWHNLQYSKGLYYPLFITWKIVGNLFWKEENLEKVSIDLDVYV